LKYFAKIRLFLHNDYVTLNTFQYRPTLPAQYFRYRGTEGSLSLIVFMSKNCLTCQFNKEPEKSPGGWIKEYNYWILEHVDEPIPIKGWLVLKTKRHTEGIAGINGKESAELGEILNIVPKVQKEVCKAAQIYIICLTEKVTHLHFHLIPRHIKETRIGPELFNVMDEVRKGRVKAVKTREAIEVVKELKKKLQT
jgi:diadenosine tetraphosphate (Ap4A) HIT family hydrolase